MATRVIEEIRPAYSLSGNVRTVDSPEDITKTFLKGAVLAWTSGYIGEAGSDPTLIAGIAANPGQNNAAAGDTTAKFYPLQGTIFEANLAQAASNTTSAATDVGKAYGIVARSTGTAHWVIDSSDTTNTRVRILGFVYPSVAGDVNARVYCSFFSANNALTVAG